MAATDSETTQAGCNATVDALSTASASAVGGPRGSSSIGALDQEHFGLVATRFVPVEMVSVRSNAAGPVLPVPSSSALAVVSRGEDDELAVIIKDACSRELMDLGLSFNSLNIKAVLSEVAEARRRESSARAKADADVVQAQEEQRSRIAQLEAAQKINDQERALNMQIASNAAEIAKAEAEKQAAVGQQREAELSANPITQARADAAQNVIQQEAEGRAQATRIRAIAEAEADAIRMKARALLESGGAYLDLRRLEMAPALTREIASALASSQFVTSGHRAAALQASTALSAPAPMMCCVWFRLSWPLR